MMIMKEYMAEKSPGLAGLEEFEFAGKVSGPCRKYIFFMFGSAA